MKTKIKNYILNSIRRFSVLFNYAFLKPPYITLDITRNCNLHCQHCHIWKNPESQHLSLENFQTIVDKLKIWIPNSQIQITGGEPFLNQDLLKMSQYATDNGFKIHLNTNLTSISEDHINDLEKSGIIGISTSIDHYQSNQHNDFRGTPFAFENTLNSIQKIKSIYPKISIYINTVITNRNYLKLNFLAKKISKWPVNGINFQVLIPTFNTKEKFNDLIKKNPLWPKSKIISLIKTDFISNPLSQINEIKKYYKAPLKVINKIVCTSGHNNFIIDQEGNIRICFAFEPIGNIFTDNPKQIWNSKKAKDMRKRIRKCQEACKIVRCNRVDVN